MKKEMDVNELQRLYLSMHKLQNIDDVYTFYYDETNNIRTLKVTENGLNIQNQQICFTLGGILYKEKRNHDVEFNKLRSILQLQKSTQEIKLCHLVKGDFLKILESKKIKTFLGWLLKEKLLIHYSVVDVLYYSTVDIVDTIISESFQGKLCHYHRQFKNDLYKILRENLEQTLNIFRFYQYPSIRKGSFPHFVSEVKDLLEYSSDLLEHFNFNMLKGVLEDAMKVKSALLFENEESNILIKSFSSFYMKKIYLFKNSLHIFDRENLIEEAFSKIVFVDNGKIIKNYQFIDSKDEICIQISDVIIGILGKCFTFLNVTKIEDIVIVLSKLSLIQQENLGILKKLLDCSITQSPAFADYLISTEDGEKVRLLLEECV